MLLSLILTGMLSGQAAEPPTHAVAAELAQNGEYAQALAMFRQLAAKNPADHEARLWIARLHVQMGNPQLAVPVYRSIVLEDPSRVDAVVGLGLTLATSGDPAEAIDVLERAERAAPENAEVVAALGRAHRRAGHAGMSLGYLQRAVTMAPSVDNRDLLEQARLNYGHRVEVGSFYEDFNSSGVPSTRSGDISIGLRITDAFRATGRGQYQRKFGEDEGRGGLGFEWRVQPQTTVAAHAWVGPGNDVLPEIDSRLEANYMGRSTEWALGYRFFRFGVADVSVLSPAVNWWATDRLCVGLRYAYAFTSFEAGVGDDGESHSGTLQGAYRLTPRLWAMLGYSRNVEDFDNFSVDRIGEFRAHTASAGIRLDLPTLSSVVGGYEYQWRRGGAEMGRFTLSFAQRF
jgi:YaiO family outer membrane protein